jgi:hypothetical protein
MVSPMRERRAWPPQDKDSDGETVAAFEAAVAVVKETVVRSGEVLVSAKEDLSDHQRWLKVQTAAVEADRDRHDRWLHRQRERQEAIGRREKKRTRRRAMRQAAVRSIKGAASAAAFAVSSALWLLAAKIVSGLNYIDVLAASGAAFVGARLRDLVLYVARAIGRGLSFAGRKARALAYSIWILLSAGFSRIAAKVHALAPSVGNFLSICFGGIAARAHDASRAVGRWLGAGFSWLSAKADMLAHWAGEALAPAFAAISARAYALAPSLSERIAKAGLVAGHYARGGALRARGLLAPAKGPRVDAENALSSPRRVTGIDLSQMLIIAGALLLVCGGLMLGGGLILRASTPSQIAATSSSEPIAWPFEHKGLPLVERSVFAFAATPEGLRIKGFSIGAVNMSDQSLGSVGGFIKPDLQARDLKLAVSVERPGDDGAGAHPPGAEAASAQPDEVIPPQAPFKFVFLFPAETANGGMTPQEVLAAYGGLMLKVHYEMAGKQRSFIQYLPPSLLKEQLDEIRAAAEGS